VSALGSQVRVLIVEDHRLLAQSLRLALEASGMSVSVPPIDLAAIRAAAREVPPDVVLLDLDLGPKAVAQADAAGTDTTAPMLDGLTLVPSFVAAGAQVVVVTGSTDRERQGRCLEQGALAVLPKTGSLDVLVAAIDAAAAGRSPVPTAERDQLLEAARGARAQRRAQLAPFERLTQRERAVFGSVVEGRGAAEIATREYVSEATVRTQIRSILAKLGVKSQLAAVAQAHHAGWLPERRTPLR
jgi:two-component system nitrate/nitrite response regulator NarL